eukprot:gene10972-3679_t
MSFKFLPTFEDDEEYNIKIIEPVYTHERFKLDFQYLNSSKETKFTTITATEDFIYGGTEEGSILKIQKKENSAIVIFRYDSTEKKEITNIQTDETCNLLFFQIGSKVGILDLYSLEPMIKFRDAKKKRILNGFINYEAKTYSLAVPNKQNGRRIILSVGKKIVTFHYADFEGNMNKEWTKEDFIIQYSTDLVFMINDILVFFIEPNYFIYIMGKGGYKLESKDLIEKTKSKNAKLIYVTTTSVGCIVYYQHGSKIDPIYLSYTSSKKLIPYVESKTIHYETKYCDIKFDGEPIDIVFSYPFFIGLIKIDSSQYLLEFKNLLHPRTTYGEDRENLKSTQDPLPYKIKGLTVAIAANKDTLFITIDEKLLSIELPTLRELMEVLIEDGLDKRAEILSIMKKTEIEKSKKVNYMTNRVTKIVLVGDENVGKSAIVHQFLQKEFLEDYFTSIENIYSHECPVGDKIFNIEITDSSGNLEFINFQNYQIEYNHCFLLVYDITSLDSFERVEKICDSLSKIRKGNDFTAYLVGNKIDLCEECRDETCVQIDQALMLARQYDISSYFEVSAKNFDQVQEVFSKIIIQHESSFRNIKTKRNRMLMKK